MSIGTWRAIFVVMCLKLTACASFGAGVSDLHITSEADYFRFIEAVRSTEYVRQDLLLRPEDRLAVPTRRVIPAAAALAVFAEQNPLATYAQLLAFVTAYDQQLQVSRALDPSLERPGSIETAILEAWVAPTNGLEGTSTNVATGVFAALGIQIPGIDETREQIVARVRGFEQAIARRYEYRQEFGEIVVAVLMERDISGMPFAGDPMDPVGRPLSSAMEVFLESNGFRPSLGVVDSTYPEINAQVAGFPQYPAFLAIRDTADGDPLPAAVVAVEQAIVGAAGTGGDLDLLSQIGTGIISSYRAAEALGPDDVIAATIALSEAELVLRTEQASDALRARLGESSGVRTRLLANTLLLSQAQSAALDRRADDYGEIATIQFEANEAYAAFETGLTVGVALVAIADGLTGGKQGRSPTEAAAGFAVLAGVGANAAGFTDGIPATEDLLKDLSAQLEQTREQLNARFDLVDQKLNGLYNATTDGLAALLVAGADRDEEIANLTENSLAALGDLADLEDALYALAEQEADLQFLADAFQYLDNRADTGTDLGYDEAGSIDFVGGTDHFLFFSTGTALAFAGSVDDPFHVTQAAETFDFSGSTVIGAQINTLNRVPDGITGAPTNLLGVGVNAPRPKLWAQGASMYAQFVRESPWYIGYQSAVQGASGGGMTDVDSLVDFGERLVDLGLAARDPQLMDALIANAREAADGVQQAIDDTVTQEFTARGLARVGDDGNFYQIDLYGIYPPEDALAVAPNIAGVTLRNAGGDTLLWTDCDGNSPVPVTCVNSPQNPINCNDNTLGEVFPCNNGAALNGWIRFVRGNQLDEDRQFIARELALAYLLRQPGEGWLFEVVFSNEFSLPYFGNDTCNFDDGRGAIEFRIFVDDGGQQPFFSIGRSFPVTMGSGAFTNTGNPATSSYADPFDECTLNSARRREIFTTGGTWNFTSLLRPSFGTNNITRNGVEPWGGQMFIWGEEEMGVQDGVDFRGLNVARLEVVRREVFDAIKSDIETRTGLVSAALDKLDDASAILDAYLVLAFDDLYRSSEILRSAFRTTPGTSSTAFRSAEVAGIIRSLSNVRNDFSPNIEDVADRIHDRIDVIEREVDAAVQIGGPVSPYIEYVLAELRAVRRDATRLAVPDTFALAGTTSSVSAGEGLLANDVSQLAIVGVGGNTVRTPLVDTSFGPGSPGYLAPLGNVVIAADGSFTYTAPVGFVGEDMFTYRTVNSFEQATDSQQILSVMSDPVTVVIRVDASCRVDLAEPFGTLDSGDVLEFITRLEAEAPDTNFFIDGVGVNLDLVTGHFGDTDLRVILGNGGGDFQMPQTLTFEDRVRCVTIGDIDNDGDQDIVAEATPFFNDGAGVFGLPFSYITGIELNENLLVDLNGDSFLDLCVTDSSALNVLLNNGNGTFGQAATYGSGDLADYVVAGDFNGDTLPDVVVGYAREGFVPHLNNGDGTLSTQSRQFRNNRLRSLDAGDVDGDGNLDLIVTWLRVNNAREVAVLRGLGDGTWEPPQVVVGGLQVEIDSLVGDLNGSGALDIAVIDPGADTITPYLNDGDGNFSIRPASPAGSVASDDALLADLDADGDLDFAGIDRAANVASLRFNDGAGMFVSGVEIPVGAVPLDIAAGELGGPAGAQQFNVFDLLAYLREFDAGCE